MKYAFEATCWNEFNELNFIPNPIEILGFTLSVWKCAGILIGLMLGYRSIALILLYLFKKRLQ